MQDLIKRAHWFYATRLIGAFLILYGVLGDKTPDRSTLILTGAGMIGWEFIRKVDPPAKE